MSPQSLFGPVGSSSSRLIVIRGNSGSGKSSVAAAVRASRPDGTVAVIGQDVIRRDLLGTGDDVGGHAPVVIDYLARLLLDRGFDLVLEGILNADWYSEVLTRLAHDHRGLTCCYLYDLTFEETVRRHQTKPIAHAFGADEMRKWWRGCQPVEGLSEHRVTDSETLDVTVNRVLKDCWPQG